MQLPDTWLGSLLAAYVLFIIGAIILTVGACGVAGALMLKPVHRQGSGVALGILLGPIGLVIAWTMRSNELLERAERAARIAAAVAATSSGGKPPWAPDEPPRRFG